MNLFCFALALLLPLILGFLLVLLCWPEKTVSPPLVWCQLCLSAGIGLGNILVHVVFDSASGRDSQHFCDLPARSRIDQPLHHHVGADSSFPVLIRHDEETNLLTRILAIAFYTSLVLAIVFVLRSMKNPHGEPDAWTFRFTRPVVFSKRGTMARDLSPKLAFSKYRSSFR